MFWYFDLFSGCLMLGFGYFDDFGDLGFWGFVLICSFWVGFDVWDVIRQSFS